MRSAHDACARYASDWANHESAEWRLSFRREPCVVTVCFCGKPCKAIRRTSRPVVTCVHTLASSSGWIFCGMTTILHHRYWASISPPPLPPLFPVSISSTLVAQFMEQEILHCRSSGVILCRRGPKQRQLLANVLMRTNGEAVGVPSTFPPFLKPWNTCSFSGEISIQLPSSLPTTA